MIIVAAKKKIHYSLYRKRALCGQTHVAGSHDRSDVTCKNCQRLMRLISVRHPLKQNGRHQMTGCDVRDFVCA